MSWLSNLLGLKGRPPTLRLKYGIRHWELPGVEAFSTLFRALNGWLPEDAILYFECAFSGPDIQAYLAGIAVSARANIARGTLWPRPARFHVPAKGNLEQLAVLAEHRERLALAEHFHAYIDGELLLEWYDVIDHPIRLNDSISEERVRVLADLLGVTYGRESD